MALKNCVDSVDIKNGNGVASDPRQLEEKPEHKGTCSQQDAKWVNAPALRNSSVACGHVNAIVAWSGTRSHRANYTTCNEDVYLQWTHAATCRLLMPGVQFRLHRMTLRSL